MSNQPYQTKRPVLEQKAEPVKTTQQIEVDRKREKSKIARIISNQLERSRVHGRD